MSILEPGTVRQIPLQFVVAPPRVAVLAPVTALEIPGFRIELRRIEVVTPDECHRIARRYRGVVGNAQGRIVDIDVDWWRWRRRIHDRGSIATAAPTATCCDEYEQSNGPQCGCRFHRFFITCFGVRSTKKRPQCFSAPNGSFALPFQGSSKASKKNTVVFVCRAQRHIMSK